MRIICGIALMLMIVVLAATAAPAPEARPLGGFEIGVWGILRRNEPRIREELKLTESQVKKIEELIAEARKASSSVRGADGNLDQQKLRDRRDLSKRHAESVAKILTTKQLMRAEQIYLQSVPLDFAIRRPQVAVALKLTEGQRGKMDLIMKEFIQDIRGLTQVGGGQERSQKIAELRKIHEEKLVNALTPAQKAKWKQLLGEPFKLEPLRPTLSK
jgi:Spy/CpxP family protein refolding chaperone